METGASSAARVVALDGVGESIDAALALDASGTRPAIVIGTPGGSADAVVAAARASLRATGADVDEWIVLRSDRATDGAFERRHDPVLDDSAQSLLVADAQWLDDVALGRLVELAAAASTAPLVVVHRHGLDRPALGELRMLARRTNRLIDVGLLSGPTLESRGIGAEEAERLLRLTGGASELLDLADDPHAFDAEIVARLSVVDDSARRAAELLAFGLDIDILGAAADAALLGSPDAVDDALGQLRVEGVIIGAVVPDGVAATVRSVCAPGRRSSLVEAIVEHGPAGASHDLAAVLLDEGDRSPAAALLYASAAHDLATHDPVRAIAYADASMASGSTSEEVAVALATAHLGQGDPLTAVADLAGRDGAEVELVRSAAWSALGDLASAAESVARSSEPALVRWAELGIVVSTTTEIRPADQAEASGRLAVALDSWWQESEHVDDLLADLQRIAVRARADRSADRWPVAPELVAVQVAARAGDLASAGRIAERADVGALHERTRLALMAWLEARRGHLEAADEALADVADDPGSPHDRLVAAGARCALAVRDADGERLDAAVAQAREALDGVPPHLHVLDIVTDMAAAASRSRVDLGDVLARCERAADRDPTGRGVADVARSRLVASLAGDDVDRIAQASAKLLGANQGDDVASPWRRIAELLADPGSADAADVIAIARELADADASYEAARLCGVVALSTADPDVSRRLLKESRVWRTTRRKVAGTPGADRSVATLSEQEERVGRMVIDGHTHKQVGAALFISPKTVEHHVAHIRTKLGCANRAEMMTALRDYLG